MKTCTQCEISKETWKFYKHKTTRDGLATYCKKCHRANMNTYMRQYYIDVTKPKLEEAKRLKKQKKESSEET